MYESMSLYSQNTTNSKQLGRVRELEEKRINKEMANIRSKFKGEKKRLDIIIVDSWLTRFFYIRG